MKFKVGDKVLPTEALLEKLPSLFERLKDGGVIQKITEREAYINFYSNHKCFLYLTSIRPAYIKNQQLEFPFTESEIL